MLLKMGVDVSRLNPKISKKLTLINKLWVTATGDEPVITSTYEGNHSPGSLHYQHKAIDFRMPSDPLLVVKALRKALGEGYDVVKEHTHIHVEYDPL